MISQCAITGGMWVRHVMGIQPMHGEPTCVDCSKTAREDGKQGAKRSTMPKLSIEQLHWLFHVPIQLGYTNWACNFQERYSWSGIRLSIDQ